MAIPENRKAAWLSLLAIAAVAAAIGLVFGQAPGPVEDAMFSKCVSCKGDEKAFLAKMEGRYTERSRTTSAPGDGLMTPDDEKYVAKLKAAISSRSRIIAKHQALSAGAMTPQATDLPTPALMSNDDKEFLATMKKRLGADHKTLGDDSLMSPDDTQFVNELKSTTEKRSALLGDDGASLTKEETTMLGGLKQRIAKRGKWLKQHNIGY